MYLSNEENLTIESFLNTVKFNPLVELVYMIDDGKRINIITVCNFEDSKNLLNGKNKKEIIKLITNSISTFNINNRGNRLKFYSDDIANYYRSIDKKEKKKYNDNNYLVHDRIPLGEALILLDKEKPDIKCKKKTK